MVNKLRNVIYVFVYVTGTLDTAISNYLGEESI